MALKKKAHGQLIVLSGPSGVGKSTLMGMIAKNVQADIDITVDDDE